MVPAVFACRAPGIQEVEFVIQNCGPRRHVDGRRGNVGPPAAHPTSATENDVQEAQTAVSQGISCPRIITRPVEPPQLLAALDATVADDPGLLGIPAAVTT